MERGTHKCKRHASSPNEQLKTLVDQKKTVERPLHSWFLRGPDIQVCPVPLRDSLPAAELKRCREEQLRKVQIRCHIRDSRRCAHQPPKRANVIHWAGFDEGAVYAMRGDGAMSGTGRKSLKALGTDRTPSH